MPFTNGSERSGVFQPLRWPLSRCLACICGLSRQSHCRSRLLPLESARLLRFTNYWFNWFSLASSLLSLHLPLCTLWINRKLFRPYPPLRELDFPTDTNNAEKITTKQNVSRARPITRDTLLARNGLTAIFVRDFQASNWYMYNVNYRQNEKIPINLHDFNDLKNHDQLQFFQYFSII